MKQIKLFDSSLRDGSQGEGIAFSVGDKLAIVEYLDALGIDFIEGGNPGSNPKDVEFFQRMRNVPLKHSRLVAFTSTHRLGISPEEDEGLRAVLESGVDCVSVFGKASAFHVTDVLNTTLEDNLALISSTVSFFVRRGRTVFFDAEQFFDGYRANGDYAMAALRAAAQAGAHALVLCDTNGGSFPFHIEEAVAAVAQAFPGLEIGIHAHNDTGMADANSIYAVRAGATQVQGTFGGFGERCGNANLCTIIPDLQLKLGYNCLSQRAMSMFTQVSRSVCEIANFALEARCPYVGASSFAHKGGMHSDAVMKRSDSYEHIPPETVGNKRRFLTSDAAGRSSLLPALQSIEPTLNRESEQTKLVLDKLKRMEHDGYQFEGAEGTVRILMERELGKFTPHFELAQFNVVINEPSAGHSSMAMIKIAVDGKYEITAAEGDGPVNALDLALRRGLEVFYPQIGRMSLEDYKVRVLGPEGTASKVRVLITSTDGRHTWRTVGVSTDIIGASWRALVDSVEYYLGTVEPERG